MNGIRIEQTKLDQLITSKHEIEILGNSIIGAALNVHRILGAGLRRELYIECLSYELEDRGFFVERDVMESVVYRGLRFDSGVTLELLVENQIAVLCLTVDEINEYHVISLLNKITHSQIKLGLILNFNTKHLRGPAIKRVVNGQL
jgi:GxxExxY protein